MTIPHDIARLSAMAAKARALAKATTDAMTINILTHYAEQCDAQAHRLKTAPGADQGAGSAEREG